MLFFVRSSQFISVAQSCPTLFHPMNLSTPGLPVHHQLPEFTQTHVHRVGDAIQPSHPLSSPSPPAPSRSQHQSLFQWVNSSHEVAKVLEFQPQYQSFQWTPRTGPYFKNSVEELQISWDSFIHQRIMETVGHNGCEECIKLSKTLKGKTNQKDAMTLAKALSQDSTTCILDVYM